MNIFSCLYKLILGPLVLLFDIVYCVMYRMTGNEGLSIIALSLAINLLILPLYRRADAMQEEERVRAEKLSRGVNHIKKVFKGDERFMMLQTYYRQNGYKPYYALNGSLSLLLEIPFFIAAFNFLSNLEILNGSSFGPIADLSKPDGLIHLGGQAVNLLPILMTAINIVSGYIYTKGMPLKSKIQLYGMALIFLVLLYSSPSGLVFYWTLNNLFSLVKNIFYKIRNPKLVLCAMCDAIAGILLVFIAFARPFASPRMSLFVTAALLLMLLPLPLYYFLKKHSGISVRISEATKTDSLIFYACCVFMTVLTGVLIPSAVIRSSPEEFVNILDFHTPLLYVLNSFLLAAGTFLVWINIFYRLASPAARRVMSLFSVIISGFAAVNYMFFGREYGNMSPLLQYDNLRYSVKADYLINTLVLIALGTVLFLLWKKAPAVMRSVSLAICATVFIMSGINVFDIQSRVDKMAQSLEEVSGSQGVSFPLDKTGKNVVVIMLDRAIGDFFPYMINEKPELQEQFAGFTYYPNTITYGNCTLLGASGLYGGYEYTPEEMNRRTDKTIPEKQDEALKIMPSVFSGSGYDVTVCDPTFAGFHWTPNLNAFDDYPEIRRYITKGLLSNTDGKTTDELLNRNFFVYSLFRSSPVVLHLTVYNKGLYNHSGKSKAIQVINDQYTASGGIDGAKGSFSDAYTVLQKMPEITDVRDTGKNTFMMIANDTAHDIVMLQEPDYSPSDSVDNSEYEAAHKVRYAADGSELTFKNAKQLTHYQCNMAAMLQLGKWMDYLRENGVYDNTRIIIVSDHGRNIDYLYDKRIKKDKGKTTPSTNDALIYDSLLLVKDFDSSEPPAVCTDFMTNADTPSIAFSGLIDDPTNPFTGKKITSDGKNVSEHHIASSKVWSLDDYTGSEKAYKKIVWVGLKGTDTSDMDSWRIIGDKLGKKDSAADD